MNIKTKIGQRLREARNAKGLTRKELVALTKTMNVSRINNYERGDRTPGPDDIKELADALEVSPAFLMCLSDDRDGKIKQTPGLGKVVPVLDFQQACNAQQHIQQLHEENNPEHLSLIPVSPEMTAFVSSEAFALQIKDQSMSPELKLNDMVVVDSQNLPKPGDFVAVQLNGSDELILRKYKQLSAAPNTKNFELIAINEDWADILVNHANDCQIVGVVVLLNRLLKQ